MVAVMGVRESRPAQADIGPAIDQEHLSQMTLGERDLEGEVLRLFVRQAEMLMARMRAQQPGLARASAHTIKGSARGIGAWRVARAAEAVERANAAELGAAVDALGAALAEANAAIAALLRGH